MHETPDRCESSAETNSPPVKTRDGGSGSETIAAQIAELGLIALFVDDAALYWNRLVHHDDAVIAVSAAHTVLENDALAAPSIRRLIDLCVYPALAGTAVRYFLHHHDYRHASEIRAADASSYDLQSTLEDLARDEADALYSDDHERLLDTEVRRFLIDGQPERIRAMSGLARRALMQSTGIAQYIREALVFPKDPIPLLRVARSLRAFGADATMNLLYQIVVKISAPEPVRLWLAAECDYTAGQYETAIAKMERVSLTDYPDEWRLEAMHRLALFNEKAGDPVRALEQLTKLKTLQSKTEQANQARQHVQYLSDLKSGIEQFPFVPDFRSDCVILTGYARSGTTYLLSKLAEHPEIDIFNEIPAYAAALTASARATAGSQLALIRSAYYAEIDRRRKNPDAICLVDKQPMLSGDAKYLANIFPRKKFIFMIRHPMDVAISCYRQFFSINASTLPFLNIDSLCDAYAKAMSNWFSIYPLHDPRVCYVRYEQFLRDRNMGLKEVFQFLGLDPLAVGRSDSANQSLLPAVTPMHHQIYQGDHFIPTIHRKFYSNLFKEQTAQKLAYWTEYLGYEPVIG